MTVAAGVFGTYRTEIGSAEDGKAVKMSTEMGRADNGRVAVTGGTARSALPERIHWVDFGGPPRGEIAGGERDHQQGRRSDREGQRILRTHMK